MAQRADHIKVNENEEYHLRTKPDDLSKLCIAVGDRDRAEMIAQKFLENSKKVADHRGLASYTGEYKNLVMSVVTTGMGGSSIGIVLPEMYRSGARIIIRVGSSSALIKKAIPGDVIIVEAACRLDGASHEWAQPWYPAYSDYRVVSQLVTSARKCTTEFGQHYFVGLEATTDCFNEGQSRPNIDGVIPPWQKERHKELLRLGVACYSMEAASLFVWCSTHKGRIPTGAINAVYGNRITNDFKQAGEELAAKIALEALVALRPLAYSFK